MKRNLSFAWAPLAALVVGAALAPSALANPSAPIRAHAAARLAPATAKAADGRERFVLEVGGHARVFVLDENAGTYAALDDATRAQVTAGGNRFLAGSIEGVPGSWVRLSRVAGAWTGAFYDGVELQLVDDAATVSTALATPPAGALVVYRLADVVLPQPGDQAGAPITYSKLVGDAAAPKAATKQMELTVVADTEFTALHGANAAAVATSRINTVDGIYSDQVGVHVVIGQWRPLGSNGTLTATNSSALIDAFRQYMVSGAGSSIPKGDLNHLFSGKDFDGNVIGVAYLSVICNTSYGYGIDQVRDASQVTALTVAHELGHNYGAPHDGEGACASASGGIMSPSINGTTQFSTCSRQQMADDVAAASCLAAYTPGGTPPQALIFRHGFE